MTKIKQDGLKSRFFLFLDDLKDYTWKKWLAIIFIVIMVGMKLHKLITTGSM